MHHPELGQFSATARTVHSTSRHLLVAAVALGLLGSVSAKELTEQEIGARLADSGNTLVGVVRTIESTITYGDPNYLKGLINTQAILDCATAGVEGKEIDTVRKIFTDGTIQSWQGNSPANDYAGTHFHFLRPRTLGNRAGLLFRSEGESGALNYYLFVLGEKQKNVYDVRDIFVVGLNEFASDTLRRTYHHLLSSFVGEVDGRVLSPVGADYVKHLQSIADMSRAMRGGKYAEALDLWRSLPADVQVERGVLMNRIDAAERVSAEERLAAMASWAKSFPDEMTLPLKMADYYVAKNQWADAERVIRKVIAMVGGDSRLAFQAGQITHRLKASNGELVKTIRPPTRSKSGEEAAKADPR